MSDIIEKVRQQLNENVDKQYKKGCQRYFKSKITNYGVKNPIVHKISKESFKEIKELPKAEIFEFIETLWQSGFIEESFIASDWTDLLHKQYAPEDFDIFQKWINNYVNNWASCDSFCNHPMGILIQKYPELLPRLIEFTNSDNIWMKRAAAVSLIIPARKGFFLDQIFQIADNLLRDKDDMVQKGYGWMLKAASEAHQKEVFEYVVKNKNTMPRTSLRYAIEKMPKDLRKIAMKK